MCLRCWRCNLLVNISLPWHFFRVVCLYNSYSFSRWNKLFSHLKKVRNCLIFRKNGPKEVWFCLKWWRQHDTKRFTGPLWGKPPVNGRFAHKEPQMRRFDDFFIISPNNQLNKQSSYRDLRRHDIHVTPLQRPSRYICHTPVCQIHTDSYGNVCTWLPRVRILRYINSLRPSDAYICR